MIKKNLHLRSIKVGALLLAIGLFFSSCEVDSGGMDVVADGTSVSKNTNEDIEKVRKIFYAIPSTIEMASMIKKSGASYNSEVLNDINNVTNYTTSRSKAINLGIYGADLSYTSIFNRNQESVFYLSCSKQLAEQLDISNALSDDLLERIEEKVEDRDSLVNIVTETYWSLDSYLKENDRDELSALMVAGGWLEGIYLGTQIYKSGEASEELKQRIVDQKFALEHLVMLLDSHNGSGAVNDVRSDLMAIMDIFERTQETNSSNNQVSGGVAVIGGTKLMMSNSDMTELTQLVQEIRTKYVS